MSTTMGLAFIPISVLLALSIYFAGQAGRKPLAAGLLTLAVVAFLFNEMALRRLHPEYNIRIDLGVLIPLTLVSAFRLLFPRVEHQALTPVSRLSSSCLTLSLVSLVFWMIPILAGLAVLKGHKAINAGATGLDRTKVVLGMILGYGQIAAAIYLWFIFE